MSDDDNIIRLLQADGAPALGGEATQRIAARAAMEFRNAQSARQKKFSFRKPLFAGFAIAAMAVLCVLAWQPDAQTSRASRERVLLAEFNEMFGGRLQAVVTANGRTRLVLGDADAVRGQPVVIRLSEKGQQVDIVSFSGENLEVSIGGRTLSFDALVDSGGRVILAGEDFLWRDGKGAGEAGLEIQAKELEM